MGESREKPPQSGRSETAAALACLPTPEREPAEELLRFARVRPHAGFVAQLIATAEHLPQARSLRRADPQEVQQSYRCAARHDVPGPQPRARTSRIA